MKSYAVGVDLGGTAIKYIVADSLGEIHFKGIIPSNGDVSAEAVLEQIVKSINFCKEYASQQGITLSGVGIGSPGVVSTDGRGIVGAAGNIAGWENVAISDYVEPLVGLGVKVNNDANLMALGESRYGAAKGATDAVFITVGTGIGGGILIDSKLFGGYANRGAEVSYMVINTEDGAQFWEDYASTSALVNSYKKRGGADVADGRFIVERYHQGEPLAVESMEKHWRYLAQGVASLIHIFSPQYVIVGGGISEAGEFYIEGIKQSLESYIVPVCAENTEVVAAELGNDAGALGAVALALE